MTQGREPLLAQVAAGEALLSEFGRRVRAEWFRAPGFHRAAQVEPDEFVVMPDHVHGIVWLADIGAGEASAAGCLDIPKIRGAGIGAGEASAAGHLDKPKIRGADASPLPLPRNGTAAGSLGAILQNFKSITTRKINALRGTPGQQVWQRNYYEHIVRSSAELDRIRAYIRDNPLRWDGTV